MGNAIGSFFSGILNAIGNLFGSPIDFISGKSCRLYLNWCPTQTPWRYSICGPTWDFICYIENFCVANLMKLTLVFFLSYIVLLFIYLLYKIGIVHCICRGLCKMVWACFASCFYSVECCCTFLWFKILLVKRVNRRRKVRDMERFDYSSGDDFAESISYQNHRYVNRLATTSSIRRREYRKDRLRNSLRPRRSSHSVRAGVDRDLRNYSYRRRQSRRWNNHVSTSKFAHSGSLRRNGHRGQRY